MSPVWGFDKLEGVRLRRTQLSRGRKLKRFRAVAARYDKRAGIFAGTIDIASLRIWLGDPPHDPQDTP